MIALFLELHCFCFMWAVSYSHTSMVCCFSKVAKVCRSNFICFVKSSKYYWNHTYYNTVIAYSCGQLIMIIISITIIHFYSPKPMEWHWFGAQSVVNDMQMSEVTSQWLRVTWISPWKKLISWCLVWMHPV